MVDTNSTPRPLRVLVLLFPEMDVLDIVGPLEVFSRSLDGGSCVFDTKIAGPSPTHTAQWLTVKADLDYDKALSTVGDYDILLVPGGPTTVVKPICVPDNPVVKIAKKFSVLERNSSDQDRPRILLSVCTGAYFLAYLGIFEDNWKCTSHRGVGADFKSYLKEHCPGAEYVATSYVDCGHLPNRINVISTGGITNGIDGSLYLVKKYFGENVHDGAVSIMDYSKMERKGIADS